MILQHADQPGLLLYLIVYNLAGTKVWSALDNDWLLLDEGTGSPDPYDLGVAMAEDASRSGWYSASISPNSDDGAIVYEVLSQSGSAPSVEDAADRRATAQVYQNSDGSEINSGTIQAAIDALTLTVDGLSETTDQVLNSIGSVGNSVDQERLLIRIANRSKKTRNSR